MFLKKETDGRNIFQCFSFSDYDNENSLAMRFSFTNHEFLVRFGLYACTGDGVMMIKSRTNAKENNFPSK